MKHRILFALTLCGFSLFGMTSLLAADTFGLYHITCPTTWPGMRDLGVKLSWSSVWYNLSFLPRPDEKYEIHADDRVFLDCAYGREGARSVRRITLAVPGHVKSCDDVMVGHPSRGCYTAPEPDGTLDPVLLYIAEPLLPTTTLLGFGIRRTLTEELNTAKDTGFTCSQSTGDNKEPLLDCQRGQDHVKIGFLKGKSRYVAQHFPQDKDTWHALHEAIILRYGLLRYFMEIGPQNTSSEYWLDLPKPDPAPHILLSFKWGEMSLLDLNAGE